MLRIRRRYFFVGISAIFIIILGLVISFFVPKKSLCANEKLSPPCGVVLNSTADTSIITGVLINKYKKGNNFYFEMTTVDTRREQYRFTFTNPPNFPKIVIDTVPLSTGETQQVNLLGKTLSIADFYNTVTVNKSLKIFAYNPKSITAKQLTGVSEDIRRCIPYQVSLLAYLQNPSFTSKLMIDFDGFKSNCHLLVATVGI